MDERHTPSVDDLWQVIQEQRATLRQQQEELLYLRTRLERTTPQQGKPRSARAGRLSRAGLLKAAALGATAVALDLGTQQTPVLANDGNAVSAGHTTSAEHATVVRFDGSGGFGGVILLGNDNTL